MENKLALITGASGGIGEAFAHVLGAEGYDLVLVARRDQELHRVKGVITSKLPVAVHVMALDLNGTDAVETLMAEMASRNLVPAIVVNNAGFGLAGPIAELSRDEQLRMIDLNVRVLTDLTLRFLPTMVANKSGGIINVASIAGFMPGPMMAVYFATKNYVLSFSDALNSELRGSGVTLTTLCPGTVKTGFQARAGQNERGSTLSAYDVASQGWAGFKAKRRVVIPGFLNQMMAYGLRLTPRRISLPLIKQVMGRRRAT
jgi:short-subunit dehydrogenase